LVSPILQKRWLAVTGLVMLACVEPGERADKHFERGQAELDAGNVRGALLEFQSALTYRPEDATLYEKIGDTLADHQQSYQESLKYYLEAMRLEPGRIHSRMRTARLIAPKDLPRARAMVMTARRTHPREPIVHRTLSHVNILDNELDQALFAARRAIDLDQTDPPSWAQLGEVHMAKIRTRRSRGERPSALLFSLALGAFDKVNETKGGKHPPAFLAKGRVYWFAGQREKAKREFSRAVELVREQGPPAEIRFVFQAVFDFATRGGEQEFLRFMLRLWVTEFPNDFGTWEALGNAYDAFPGHSGEEIFLELLDTNPDNPRAHSLYARWLTRQNRIEDARTHIERARADGIDNPLLSEELVQLELRNADLAAARATWIEMTEKDPDGLATRVAGARIALAEGRIGDAIATLEALEETEYNHELLRLLTVAHHAAGNFADAQRTVERALTLGPPSEIPLQRLRARIAVDDSNWAQALSAYETLSELDVKLSPEERAGYAAALYNHDRAPQGRVLLEDLLRARPPAPRATLVFAEFEGEANPKRAYDLLTRAHRWVPGNTDVLEALTRIDMERDQPLVAIRRIGQLVEDRRASPKALMLRAETLAQLRSFEAAEADVLRALEANPMLPGAIDLLHSLYRVQGKSSEALRTFEQADEAGVLHVAARHLLARLYLEERETERARDMLERVVAEAPQRWSALADLAYVLAQRGEDLDRALELAREAVTASREDPRALDAVGWVELHSGRADAALEHFDGGIRAVGRTSEPMFPTLQYHRGLALRALGREEDAAGAFEEALRHGNFPEAENARQQLEAARHPELAPNPS
jgi:tetratricopeptide (TPR) repeat protein